MEGDSVTLHTDAKINQGENITWYFNDTLIAQINGDLSESCTVDHCNAVTLIIKSRLKLHCRTGSLTITNIHSADAGVYKVKISNNTRENDKNFNIAVDNTIKEDIIKNEGEAVTLDPCEMRKANYSMTWYFCGDILITGDPSKTCIDVQCEEQFRDKLKMDHQNGSLTIRNINTGDSEVCKLKIVISDRYVSIIRRKRFNVIVNSEQKGNQQQSAAVEICNGVFLMLLLAAATAAAVMIYRRLHRKLRGTPWHENDADNPNNIPLREFRVL
ncbi:uncharacterized protein LOC100003705 [Danio rerio]|uniref:Uncharacterized protein LOC100003705 n=1 Tax=Danio rerio TaxID=7955 RepID=A7MBV7_DANRE|nr:uncharacterized protein LOC100003705 [Danio rerio]AAI51933.1 Zgc:171699 protein [Danio rerio]|eukprot:NP_001103207.1 uncharacterized protein LOC100003705 [Danio rerio]